MYRQYLIVGILLTFQVLAFSQLQYSNDQVEVIRLDETVYLLKENYSFTANSLAISGEKELLLIDTGFREIARDYFDAVSYLGMEVAFIINSHGHSDHVGANTLFGKDVRIVGHEECKEQFTRAGKITDTFEDEFHFDFSGHQVNCIAFPGGHSECDILIHIPDLKLAYLGDIYLSESFPLVIINAGSSVQQMVAILKRIYEMLPADTRLISGHGKETTMEYMGEYIGMLDTTIGLVREEMVKGKTLQKIKNDDVLADWGEWGRFFPFITKESWIEQIYLSYSQ